MKELICIVCPNSCLLRQDENGQISGNKCQRGLAFFENELKCPKRTLQTTVKTIFKDVPVISVKTTNEVNKKDLFLIMKELNKVTLDKHYHYGDTIIKNILNSGVDIVITSNLLEEERK